jgi:hypothetical protein
MEKVRRGKIKDNRKLKLRRVEITKGINGQEIMEREIFK